MAVGENSDVLAVTSYLLALFIYDQLAVEFSALGKMIRERIPVAELLSVYTVVGSSAGLDGDDIMILTRKDRPKAVHGSGNRLRYLPAEIWVRNSLLNPNETS